MDLKKIHHYQNRIDFDPLSKWPPHLPAYAYKNVLICGFNLDGEHPVFELPLPQEFLVSKLLQEIYPHLSMPEIARLLAHPLSNELTDSKDLIESFGFHDSPDLRRVLQLITQLPRAFQDWISTKKVGAQELYPILNLRLEDSRALTSHLAVLRETKSEIIQRIEWTCDLSLMGHQIQSLFDLSLEQLKKLRFPVATQRDQQLQSAALPWSSNVKSRMQRRGDQAGFDIHFFASSPIELNKLAENLKKVATAWTSNLNQN